MVHVSSLLGLLLPLCFLSSSADAQAQFLLKKPLNQAAPTVEQLAAAFKGGDGDGDIFLGEENYSGYLDVGKFSGGKMFYWYFPSRKNKATDPLVLWLNGGPGCSSMLALLSENGPYWVNKNESNFATLRLNEHSWTESANVVFVDQPLGVGFSIGSDPMNFSSDEEMVGENMAEFLGKFVQKFSDLKNRPFYITGESYAGHYVPSIAYTLVNKPVEGVNLQGVGVGNGWVHPYIQHPAYADYALEEKLVSAEVAAKASEDYKHCQELIANGSWQVANAVCGEIMGRLLGPLNPYDIRQNCEIPGLCYNMTELDTFLNRKDVQQRLGVSKSWEACDPMVFTLMVGDEHVDQTYKLQRLIEKGVEVLIYHGDKDFICNWLGGLWFTDAIEWEGKEQFAKMELAPWLVNGKPAGTYKKLGKLAFLRVFDAGHMVPMDQPENALVMLQQLINGQSYGGDDTPKLSQTPALLVQ